MKTKKLIKLISPFKFQLQLQLANQSISRVSFIEHLKKYGILPITDHERIQEQQLNYQLYIYKQINLDKKQQLVKIHDIGQFDLYYIVEEGNISAILKFCNNQQGEEEEKEEEEEEKVKELNHQNQGQDYNNQEEELEAKDNVVQNQRELIKWQSIRDKNEVHNEKKRRLISKIFKKVNENNNQAIINHNPQEQISVTGQKKLLVNLKPNKKSIKLSQIRKIYSNNNERQQQKEYHERKQKLENQYQTEKIFIKFSLNNKIIESLQVKKMQKIRSQILKDYDIFYDQKLTKPIKNKDFIIAINSRVLYCKPITNQKINQKQHFPRSKNLPIYKRIKQNQEIVQKQQVFEEFHQQQSIHYQNEENILKTPQNSSNIVSKQDNLSSIFRIHKRKPNIFSNNSAIQSRQQSHQDHLNLSPIIHKLTLQPKLIQQQQSSILQKNKSKIILRTKVNKTTPKIKEKNNVEHEQLQQFLNEQIIPEQYNGPQSKKNTGRNLVK